MPVLENVITKISEQVWASPDGQRKIYKLGLEWQDKPVEAKTYSDQIATIGWQGTVETYEKPGRNGSETFVKQPPKEGGGFGGGNTVRSGNPGNRGTSDPFTMYLSYAKDITVALVAGAYALDAKAAAKLDYSDLIDQTLVGAYALYNGRPEAKADAAAAKQPTKPEAPNMEVVDDVTPVSDEDLARINDIFTKKEE